jgi:Ribbon-helix-helix protein, copG family
MLISLRIPDELVAELDAIAKAERRSRNQVILMRLENPLLATTRQEPIELARTMLGPGALIPCADPQKLTRAEVMEAAERKRAMHDPKTCRIYKCGMCAGMKELPIIKRGGA